MAELKKYKSIYEILNDPKVDKNLRRGILEAIKPLEEEIRLATIPNPLSQENPTYSSCIKANHCPATAVKNMSVQGYTAAPAFNIFGPSGKQSLSSYRVKSHTGRIILEGANASGQFSVDVFKGGAKNVALKQLRDVLKGKVKDEVIDTVFNPKNYAMISIWSENSKPTRGFIAVGMKRQVLIPDHEEVIVNVRVDPLLPMMWKMTVQAADYVSKV